MSRSRSILYGAPLLLLLTSCTTTQNTLAQDRAWEAWNSCPKAANIRLDRIDVNGGIYYSAVERIGRDDRAEQLHQKLLRDYSNE